MLVVDLLNAFWVWRSFGEIRMMPIYFCNGTFAIDKLKFWFCGISGRQSVNFDTETKRDRSAQNTQIRIREKCVDVEMLCLLILQLDNFSSGEVKHYPVPLFSWEVHSSGPFKTIVTESVVGRSAGVALATKCANRVMHPDFEIQDRRHQKSKTGILVDL